jgi:hypothetical protein
VVEWVLGCPLSLNKFNDTCSVAGCQVRDKDGSGRRVCGAALLLVKLVYQDSEDIGYVLRCLLSVNVVTEIDTTMVFSIELVLRQKDCSNGKDREYMVCILFRAKRREIARGKSEYSTPVEHSLSPALGIEPRRNHYGDRLVSFDHGYLGSFWTSLNLCLYFFRKILYNVYVV